MKNLRKRPFMKWLVMDMTKLTVSLLHSEPCCFCIASESPSLIKSCRAPANHANQGMQSNPKLALLRILVVSMFFCSMV